MEAFLGFAKSLGLWWKGYPGCHKEWLGPWLAAEALSVLTNEEEVTRSAARLDAKLAGAVDANTARRARTRFTQTVKTARYDSLHKGAVLVARICSMLGCNGDGREANVVREEAKVVVGTLVLKLVELVELVEMSVMSVERACVWTTSCTYIAMLQIQ